VTKFWTAFECAPAQCVKTLRRRVEANSPQTYDNSEVLQQRQFAEKEWPAIPYFGGEKFVLWWRTATCGCDVAIDQTKSIVTRDGRSLICEPEFLKSTVKPVSASVSCEHSACAVPSVCCRCQSHEKELGVWIAKARIWLSPILPILKPLGLFFGNLLPPSYQTWAASTRYDLSLN
jgi:hypothetical protein